MARKSSPLNVGAIKEKIDKGEVKVKGIKATKNKATAQNKAHVVTGTEGKITDAKIIECLKVQEKPITSTQLRDTLGFKSRTQARRIMRRLAKQGVVKITPKQVSDKRRVFTFEIA